MECRFTKEKGVITERERIDAFLRFQLPLLSNGKWTLKIERHTERRSISQNALMWMWFACIADVHGCTPQDVHDHYCAVFLQKQDVLGKGVIAGKTSKLTTEGMTDFLSRIQADASSEWGITLPLPQDKYYEEFIETYKGRI